MPVLATLQQMRRAHSSCFLSLALVFSLLADLHWLFSLPAVAFLGFTAFNMIEAAGAGCGSCTSPSVLQPKQRLSRLLGGAVFGAVTLLLWGLSGFSLFRLLALITGWFALSFITCAFTGYGGRRSFIAQCAWFIPCLLCRMP